MGCNCNTRPPFFFFFLPKDFFFLNPSLGRGDYEKVFNV